MNYQIIPSALLISLLLTFLFFLLSGRGSWRSLFLFFFIIFLVTWTGQFWITPFGPIIWGVSLLPLVFVALIFSLLIIALSTPEKVSSDKKTGTTAEEEYFFETGMFFWILIVILLTSIVIGYYKIPPIPDIINNLHAEL